MTEEVERTATASAAEEEAPPPPAAPPNDDKLQPLRELVDRLYRFRDRYFESHSVEADAGNKAADVERETQRTLKELEEHEEDALAVRGGEQRNDQRAEFLLLKGRCLNAPAAYSAAAEECLSRAVKLEPSLAEAWNTLGDQYWKKGDLEAARHCFSGALQRCGQNKVSLRSLSMLLRQEELPKNNNTNNNAAAERVKRALEGVDLARRAVQLDVTDATSWYVLGNAYLSLFFFHGGSSSASASARTTSLQRALNAYTQSERAEGGGGGDNADLHFNRANLFQYEEMFGEALAGYRRAAALEPDWDEPREKRRCLLEYLEKVSELVASKGKTKAGRLRAMLAELNAPVPVPGGPRRTQGSPTEPEPRALSALSALEPGHNAGVAVRGKVVFSLAPAGRVAFTFGLLDGEGTCAAVTVYNTAASWAVMIGDTVLVPEPQVKRHSVARGGGDHDGALEFTSIRVDSPLLLVVNGKTQKVQSQVAVSVSYKPGDR